MNSTPSTPSPAEGGNRETRRAAAKGGKKAPKVNVVNKSSNPAGQAIVEEFLNDYQALVDKHGCKFTAKLEVTTSGITPVLGVMLTPKIEIKKAEEQSAADAAAEAAETAPAAEAGTVGDEESAPAA